MSLPPKESISSGRSLVILAGLSLLAGMVAGLVGALFRRVLEAADSCREAVIGWSYQFNLFDGKLLDHLMGASLVVGLAAACTALSAWLVRRFSPESSGSGIPHVEAVLHQEIPPASLLLIPVKFVGGILAMGAGLVLGREGPTVQMGASIAHEMGKMFRLCPADARTLLAAGAGAGLATAFNAPIAGAVFVLEELVRRFDTRITIATLGASATAIAVSQFFLGVQPDFRVQSLPNPAVGSLGAYLLLGALTGLIGVAYNRAILKAYLAAGQMRNFPVEFRAGLVGGMVGLLAWFSPALVGGGEAIVQRILDGKVVFHLLPLLFAARFVLGVVSYAAGTPGGLFAPMLVLGAQLGYFYGAFACHWFPGYGEQIAPYVVAGMAAFFTAVVRAPVTGMILIVELTSCDTQLLPLLAACFAAMLIPTVLKNPPVYDSLGKLWQ